MADRARSLNFVASTNGTVDLFFTSTSQIKCEEATVDGVKGVRCTSA